MKDSDNYFFGVAVIILVAAILASGQQPQLVDQCPAQHPNAKAEAFVIGSIGIGLIMTLIFVFAGFMIVTELIVSMMFLPLLPLMMPIMFLRAMVEAWETPREQRRIEQ